MSSSKTIFSMLTAKGNAPKSSVKKPDVVLNAQSESPTKTLKNEKDKPVDMLALLKSCFPTPTDKELTPQG